MFKHPTAIVGIAVSAVVAHSILAQTPTIAVTESSIAPRSDALVLEESDQPQTPVDNAEGLVAVGEHVEAINVVELEIEKIERRSNRYNIELARPLVVLGDALAGVGDRKGALGAYDRAVHITRINRGLHHPSQVEIVYREASIIAANGDLAQANRRHEYAYDILLRSYGGGNPSLLPGIFSLADWYLVNYNIFSARGLYEHALSVADETLAAADPSRLRALRGMAATYRSERFPPYHKETTSGTSHQVGYRYGAMPVINNFARGEHALIEVVNVIMASAAGSSDEDVADAVLELGDWYLIFGKHDRATTLYRHVWGLLEAKPDQLAEIFDSPTPLYLPLPGDPDTDEDAAGRPRSGVVELSFRVDASGGVSRIATLHSEPQNLMDVKVRRAVRRARYRPAFDGEATLATDDVRVSHEFMYYPTDDFPPDGGSKVRTDAANHPGGAVREPVSFVHHLGENRRIAGTAPTGFSRRLR